MSLIRLEMSAWSAKENTLSDLNWTVEKGQTWAILGLNGAGKSTLLRLLTAEFSLLKGRLRYLATPLVMETSQVFVNTSVSSVPLSLSVCLNI